MPPLDLRPRRIHHARPRRRVIAGITPPREPVWTREELRALLEAVEGDRLEALWRVAVATGARRGELLGLSRLGFSAEARTLEITQQLVPTRGGPTIAECKTRGSHRMLSLDAETVDALEAHREHQLAEREAAGDAYVDADLIFCDELGGTIDPRRLTESFHAHRERAGIRPGRLHDVRLARRRTCSRPACRFTSSAGGSGTRARWSRCASARTSCRTRTSRLPRSWRPCSRALVSGAFATAAQTRMVERGGEKILL